MVDSSGENEFTSARRVQNRLFFQGAFWSLVGFVHCVLTGEQPVPGGLKGAGLFLFKGQLQNFVQSVDQ